MQISERRKEARPHVPGVAILQRIDNDDSGHSLNREVLTPGGAIIYTTHGDRIRMSMQDMPSALDTFKPQLLALAYVNDQGEFVLKDRALNFTTTVTSGTPKEQQAQSVTIPDASFLYAWGATQADAGKAVREASKRLFTTRT